ncbi:Alcohol dehydrogenase 7 [Paraphaeosphaeria sporulosa]
MQLGATNYIDTSKRDAANELQDMGGASLIVVTAPNAYIISGLVGALGRLGKLLILARNSALSWSFLSRGLKLEIGGSVHVWPAGHALDSEEAIDFAKRQGVKCMEEKFLLEMVEKAIKALTSNAVRFRSVPVIECRAAPSVEGLGGSGVVAMSPASRRYVGGRFNAARKQDVAILDHRDLRVVVQHCTRRARIGRAAVDSGTGDALIACRRPPLTRMLRTGAHRSQGANDEAPTRGCRTDGHQRVSGRSYLHLMLQGTALTITKHASNRHQLLRFRRHLDAPQAHAHNGMSNRPSRTSPPPFLPSFPSSACAERLSTRRSLSLQVQRRLTHFLTSLSFCLISLFALQNVH